VEKYVIAGEATDDNTIGRMRFGCWITKATHTLKICNTDCFSTKKLITRTRLNIAFISAFPVLL
jgi:hypothetical protein